MCTEFSGEIFCARLLGMQRIVHRNYRSAFLGQFNKHREFCSNLNITVRLAVSICVM